MKYDTSLADKAYELAEKWDAARDTEVADLSFTSHDVNSFSSLQKSKFILLTSFHYADIL